MKLITNLKKAVLTLGKRGQHNAVKILCLGIGMAAGAVLIAKVWMMQHYDAFYPGADRIYVVNEAIVMNGEYGEFHQTPGAFGPGLKRYAPQVEAATRWTWMGADQTLVTEDNRRLKANVQFADSCLFDVLPRPVLAGDAKDVLSRPGYCLIPRSLAEAVGGDVLGQTLRLHTDDGYKFTVGGIYEDYPVNSMNWQLGVLVHLHNIADFSGDGSTNWMGNDRYKTFVRLAPGTAPADIRPGVERMMEENIPLDELKTAGIGFDITFTQISELTSHEGYTKMLSWILSLLAFILIFCAVMNYLLIVIGGMASRAKEMAVHKCYGAEEGDVYGIVFAESLLHLLLSVGVAGVLLYLSKGTIEHLADAPLSTLLLSRGAWVLGAVCLGVLLLTGLVPGWLYNHVPVVAAFKGYTQTHRHWKLWLLAVQFVAAGFLVSLLFVIQRQYRLMTNEDTGYDYRNLVHIDMSEVDAERRAVALTELAQLPGAQGVASAYDLLPHGASGNNIYLPGDDREYLNVADLYDVGRDYLWVMGIPLLQGRDFTQEDAARKEVMVSHEFVERMKELAGWDDNAVGRQILITGHDYINIPFTIVGVYGDVRVGSMTAKDERPTVMFRYDNNRVEQHLFVRFADLQTADVLAVQAKLKELYPTQDLVAETYQNILVDEYADSRKFRDTVLIGGIVTLLIALIGLVGYTNNEVNRRHKEIAIRKVNGALTLDVLRLFMKDILRVAVPSLAVGGVGAYLVAGQWQQTFADKAPLSVLLFVGCGLLVLAIILAVVNLNCYRVAQGNPVDYLKGE